VGQGSVSVDDRIEGEHLAMDPQDPEDLRVEVQGHLHAEVVPLHIECGGAELDDAVQIIASPVD